MNILYRTFRDAGIALRNPKQGADVLKRRVKRRYQRQEARKKGKEKSFVFVNDLCGRSVHEVLDAMSQRWDCVQIERYSGYCWLAIQDHDLFAVANSLVALFPDASGFSDCGECLWKSGGSANVRPQDAFVDIELTDTSSRPFTVRLEPYEHSDDEKWTSRNSNNRHARVIYGPSLSASRVEEFIRPRVDYDKEIDIVYTWVNHADPRWVELFSKYREQRREKRDTDSSSLARFTDNNELKYSLRSIYKNLSWVRHIYIVSNCAPPEWLKINDGRIFWISHEEIIEDRYLPTFNSHVIESCLYRIDGLSDKFLYLNDDVLITRPLSPSNFIDEADRSMCFLESYGVVSEQAKAGDPDYLNASRNSAACVRSLFNHWPTQLHEHTVFSLDKSLFARIEGELLTEINKFRSNRFRGLNDLNLTSFLHHHFGIQTGDVVKSQLSTLLVKNNDVRGSSKLKESRQYDTVCVNEGAGVTVSRWNESIELFMRESFPVASPWEQKRSDSQS